MHYTSLCNEILTKGEGGFINMDWMNRGAQNGQSANQPVGPNTNTTSGRSKRGKADGMRYVTVALLFSGAILLIALIGALVFGGNTVKESEHLDKSKFQAVFLNGGQVYFGHVTALNDKYVSMDDIYYLRVNQQVQPNQQGSTSNDVSLVKLGCELHGPQDSMTINHDQVVFWENLKDDGQVAKAVAEYVKQNPNGQKCDTASTQNTNTTTPTTTTPTTTTTKKP